MFRDGFLVALLNPKTTIFFAAFLPQFMSSTSPTIEQTLALALTFIVIAGTSDSLYALAAGTVGPSLAGAERLRSVGRFFRGDVISALPPSRPSAARALSNDRDS